MANPIMSRAATLLQNAGALGSRRVGAVPCIPIISSIANEMAHRQNRHVHTAPRGYNEALEKLSQLGSNRSATLLFESPTGAASPSSAASHGDLNDAAIPEMRAWLLRAGYSPERDLCKMRHIHVAGTKGKGSVCAYATAALLSKHRRVGTYTSPHLVHPRERIAIDGEPVSQELFAKAFFDLWDRFTEAARAEGRPASDAEGVASKPFFFRYLTIMAWHIFLGQGIGDVVLECGIGGEYDATNVLPPQAVSAAVVTQLGLDHVAMLGDTVEQIAWHKAGIFKPGRRAFTRRLDDQPRVMEVLRARARQKGAILVELDDGEVDSWGIIDGSSDVWSTPPFQKQNQALAALAVMDHLEPNRHAAPSGLLDLPNDLYESLQGLHLPGRQELLKEGDVLWYYDGAHTRESLEETAKWFIKDLAPDEKAVLVFNQQERDASELLTHLIEAVEKITYRRDVFSHAVFSTNHTSFLDPDGKEWDLAVQKKAAVKMRQLVPGCQVDVVGNVMDACLDASRAARSHGRQGKVLVTGSMHLVGNMKRALDPGTLL